MNIRCGGCHGSIWVEMDQLAAQSLAVQCSNCRKDYVLEGGRDAGATGARLAGEARNLAREAQLDLPSAYSVLLGAITLEEILELDDPSSSTSQTATTRVPSTKSAYDPAFQPAIDIGSLTALQAMQRGNRQRYATLVSQRHRLSGDVALAVADNQVSLLEAIRRRGPDPGPAVTLTVAPTQRSGSRLTLFALGATVVLVVIVAVFQLSRSAAPEAAAGSSVRTVLGAKVRTDEGGRVLEVSAPDPKTVLSAYCASDRDRRFEPIDLIPTTDSGDGGRLGLLRRTGRSAEILSIAVREDREGNRWVAGDGKNPLVPHTAPRAAAEAVRMR